MVLFFYLKNTSICMFKIWKRRSYLFKLLILPGIRRNEAVNPYHYDIKHMQTYSFPDRREWIRVSHFSWQFPKFDRVIHVRNEARPTKCQKTPTSKKCCYCPHDGTVRVLPRPPATAILVRSTLMWNLCRFKDQIRWRKEHSQTFLVFGDICEVLCTKRPRHRLQNRSSKEGLIKI
jgi:hypothetical protein